jgi:hypothetical protein
MTFDELLVEDRIETLRRLDTAWVRFEEEAHAAYGGSWRRSLAAALVRIGTWLDRGAVERAAPVMRQAH